jgi:hypothetical protein
MDEKTIAVLREKAEEIRGAIWDHSLVRTIGPGNSEKTKNLKFHHSLGETAHYFALGKFTGNIDTTTGTNILSALERCQVTDEKSEYFGAFPCYSEDEVPTDGSCVFPIAAPLETVKIAAAQSLALGELAIIDRILERAGRWLSR